MDELRAFFNNPFPSSSQIIKLRGPTTGGHRITKEDNINQLNKPEEHRRSVLVSGTDYAREIKEKETAIYLKVFNALYMFIKLLLTVFNFDVFQK